MRTVFVVLGLFLALAPGFSQGVAANQLRFFPQATVAVDVELSRFGTYLALADATEGNSVSVFDANSELLWRLKQRVYWAATFKHSPILAFAPDESFLIFPAYRTDRDIALVNPKTGEPLAVLTEHTGTVDALGLSPDGESLVTGSSNELFLWKRAGASYRVVDRLGERTSRETSTRAIAFSPDGGLVAVSEYGQMVRRLAVYRVAGGRLELADSIENQENNLGHEYGPVAFSPDGKRLVAGYSDSLRTFRRSGDHFEAAGSLDAIELGSVDSLAFSPDGELLLTGHYRDLRVWRFENGVWTPATTFSPHHGLVRDLAFSPDGTRLAIAGREDTAALGLWELKGAGASPFGKLLTLLEGRVSAAQRRFLDEARSLRLLVLLPAALTAPRDMFETEGEYAGRRKAAQAQAAGLLQEQTEVRYAAQRLPSNGALYEVSVPLQAQGTYSIDAQTYTFRFMDTDASVRLERDPAKELYQNWQKARVLATRLQTPEGTTYEDFRLVLPVSSVQVPLGLSENPFTGAKLDRYGLRVPSVAVGPDLLVKDLAIQGVFPSLFRYYAENALGGLVLQNTGSTPLTGLSVRFFVPGLMKSPTAAVAPTALGVGQVADVTIRALFDPAVLDRAEGSSVSAELQVEYVSGTKKYSQNITRNLGILNRNALRWTDDRTVGAFMGINDPAFLRWSGQVMGMVDDRPTNLLTRNLLSAMRLFSALKASGLRYVVDPASAYESLSRDASAIDFVRFPVETLDSRSGDCDDLAVLFASLLESVGIESAFITTPGHIFTAFNLGVAPELATKLLANADDLIVRDGETWVPVETTLIDGGFLKAWQTGAREWKEGQARAAVGFFTAREAWKLYAPAGFIGSSSGPIPVRERVVELFEKELVALKSAALGPKEKELLELLAKGPSPAQENKLGILYAQFGELEKALERFEKALASKSYVPALLNAANVYGLKQDHEKAQEYLKRAETQEPENTRVLIALALSLYQSGNEADASSTFARMRTLDPGLAAQYPLFGSISSASGGQGRASDVATGTEARVSNWVE